MKYLLKTILIFICISSFSQEVKFTIESDTNSLLIGAPCYINIKLEVSASISKNDIIFPKLFDIDTLDNNWEIWNVDSIMISNNINSKGDYLTTYSQKITLANFDTGKVELLPFSAIINDSLILSNNLIFNIYYTTLDDSGNIKNIKDIKLDPLTFSDKLKAIFYKYYWILIIVIFCIALWYIYKKHLYYREDNTEQTPSIPIAIILLKTLNDIEQKKLWQNSKYKLYFSQVIDVIWKFLEARFEIYTFEKTSNEIINSMKIKNISKEDIKNIQKSFFISDMVKFAKQTPTKDENEFVMLIAREFIQKYRDDIIKETTEESKEK
jgi:hypothetical protein